MATPLATVPSARLLAQLKTLVQRDNEFEAELLSHLGEVDARRLYLDEACSSMFVYCVRVLHFAEAVAYKRIAAARAARRHPELLQAVRSGDLHLTAASLLAPRLTDANAPELVAAVRHRTADEIRRLLANRSPRLDVAAGMRRISNSAPQASRGGEGRRAGADLGLEKEGDRTEPAAARSASGEGAPGLPEPRSESAPALSVAPKRPPEPLGGDRYLVRFTADAELHAQLQELRALMRHRVRDGDLGRILSRAVALLLEQVRKEKIGECSKPRSVRASGGTASRHIPARIRRAVWKRDGGRCTFVSGAGQRCPAREFLEFHHLDPWARSRVHGEDGIALLCRAHNQHEARRDFGVQHMARFRKASRQGTGLDSNPVSAGPG